ncbi:MAG: OmpA family protein [Pseudomonadota bacterium]
MAITGYSMLSIAAFAAAGIASVAMASFAATRIEERSAEDVTAAMQDASLDWVDVSVDGLNVTLSGTAPTEAQRFRATSLARSIVDDGRVIVRLDVAAPDTITPPSFQLEMLRNGDGLSLIGLVPDALGDGGVAERLSAVTEGIDVVDLVDSADYAVPEGWEVALDYGLSAILELPRSKVSVYSDRVEIEAVSESQQQRDALLASLRSAQPDGIEILLDISAPRPVIAPFSLRFVLDEDGARFEDCSAETDAGRARILASAAELGVPEDADCAIGLGMPSPQWPQAVSQALAALGEIGTGTVSFSDADISLIAGPRTEQDLFDRVIGDLEADLPEVFSLRAVLPATPDPNTTAQGPAQFSAELNEEGMIELRGRLPDDRIEAAVLSFAQAEFGHSNVRLATRQVEDLPTEWSVRVLAGLAALGVLNSGSLQVEPEMVRLSGETGSQTALSDASRILAERLGDTASFDLDITYIEELDPASAIPTEAECVARLNGILDETKISFDPGSVEINEEAALVLDAIAEVLPDCRHVEMEIGGHTDSQGRESMNARLSQARADAVLNGLLGRNILIGNLSSRGYGESRPIADNETEEGREANRRIEFRLLAEVIEAAAEAEVAERNETLLAVRPVPRPDRAAEESDAEGADNE